MAGGLPMWLLAPASGEKRITTAARLARGKGGGAYDEAALREELRALRERCRREAAALEARLGDTLLSRLGERPMRAATARIAAQRIAVMVAPGRQVVVNRSATVQELRPYLAELGVRVVESYDEQFARPAEAARRHWELTAPSAEATWEAFGAFQPVPPPRPEAGYVAVLGVNAISADDGGLYFAQHLQNIGEMLARACQLVVLVAANKIQPDGASAALVTRAMARFGTAAMALGAGRRGGGQGVPAGAPAPEQRIGVILLDNGRSAWPGSPFERLFDCIGCRACAQECPTQAYYGERTGWTPRDYLAAFLSGESSSLDWCAGCGRCGTLCPLGIDVPGLIAEAKTRRPVAVRDRLFTHIETMFRLTSATAPLSNVALRVGPLRGAMEKATGIDRRRRLPSFARPTARRAAGGERRVAYYRGCYAYYSDPELGEAAARILDHQGYGVVVAPQTCCGVAAFAYGDRSAALAQARKTVSALYPLVADGLEVLVTCPSCALTLQRDIPRLLDDMPEAQAVAARTREVSEFLLERKARGELRDDLAPLPLTVGYHVPCHLKIRGKGGEVPALLGLVPGLTVRTIDRGCCGMSGSFGLKKAHYAASQEIGGGLFMALREEGIAEGITDCGACEMQMRAGSGLQVRHPLKLLWESYAMANRGTVPASPRKQC